MNDVDWSALSARIQSWIDDDPDPETAAELTALLAQAATAEDHPARVELADRFSGLLAFGTAGLRGALAGGPNRMNRAVVIRAAAGLAATLAHTLATQGATSPARVVVGYDARFKSHDFAVDTAAVMTAAGCEVFLLPSALPTPVLAGAVQRLGADAGVMVTASHNPPQDNGYKVYLGGRVVSDAGSGAQIVPPWDGLIAEQIAAVPSVTGTPRATDGWTMLDATDVDAYVARVLAGVQAITGPIEPAVAADLRIVLTPLHGVGGAVAARVLREAGFTDVHLVPEQAEPDPKFPTVAFPNPEEPGAIDLSIALAERIGADLVIALDPDADRCALATVDQHTGAWRMLHGDETGALLGKTVAAAVSARQPATPDAPAPALANSIVSSRLLARIARAHGLRHAWTLTGFKWISRVPGIAFGYEEALGYCVDPDGVRDKDGISAGLLAAIVTARLKADGRQIMDVLDDLARQHGLHLSSQLSGRFTDLAQIPATMQRLRTAPPTELSGSPVIAVVDLAAGTDEERGGLPPTDGLRLLCQDDTRVVVRPSGTEPKVKCYLEVIVPVEAEAPVATVTWARQAATERLDRVRADMAAALGL